MADNPDPKVHLKSLADVLAEELGGHPGTAETQELPVEEKQARLRAVYNRIHAEQPERSVLCLSGGGIRSGIFSLGIQQLLGAQSQKRVPADFRERRFRTSAARAASISLVIWHGESL